jgi:hypothetical protein
MKQIKELERLLGKMTMGNKLLKEAVEYGRQKVDTARALVAGGWRISLVSRCLRISRAQLHAMPHIHTVIGALPTYGYRGVWALLRRQSETDDMAVIYAKIPHHASECAAA